MNQYAVFFIDTRERGHVAAIAAQNPQEALDRLIANRQSYEGVGGWRPLSLEDVVEINPANAEDGVQILWHQDYD